MDFGRVEYTCTEPEEGTGSIVLKLTLIGQGDDELLAVKGIVGARQKRIVRLALEAEEQGCLLSYEDLCALLLTSLSTVKRDVVFLEAQGISVPLKNRRKCSREGETKKTPDNGRHSNGLWEGRVYLHRA